MTIQVTEEIINDPLESIKVSKRERDNVTGHERTSSRAKQHKKIEAKGSLAKKNMISAADILDVGNELLLQVLFKAFNTVEYFKEIACEEDPMTFMHNQVLLVDRVLIFHLPLEKKSTLTIIFCFVKVNRISPEDTAVISV